MSPVPADVERLAALAAVLAPSRAGPLLAGVAAPHDAGAAARGAELGALPRPSRLAALGRALGRCAATPGHGATPREALLARLGSPLSQAEPVVQRDPPAWSGRAPELEPLARCVNEPPAMDGLPLTLPVVTPGFAALTAHARDVGAEVARTVAAALASLLGEEVRVAGRPLPAPGAAAAGVARVTISLGALGATAALEVDAAFLARALERLSRSAPTTPAALAPSGAEQSLLALLALVALEATGASVATVLAPRLALGGGAPAPGAALAVALDLVAGDDHGTGRLSLPPAALRALGAGPPSPGPAATVRVGASLRSGTVTLAADELAALACGDVLLADVEPGPAELVLPGGLTLRGRAGDETFHVEEIAMTEPRHAYPITLSVEIARVTLTLGELACLEPGAALALGARKDGAVVLRAGEHVVARGQLVDVEGALGIRIAQLGELP